METVGSTDGTSIAFDRYGHGPPIVLVGGAFQYRAFDPRTAAMAQGRPLTRAEWASVMPPTLVAVGGEESSVDAQRDASARGLPSRRAAPHARGTDAHGEAPGPRSRAHRVLR
jgi:hypothetical protein